MRQQYYHTFRDIQPLETSLGLYVLGRLIKSESYVIWDGVSFWSLPPLAVQAHAHDSHPNLR